MRWALLAVLWGCQRTPPPTDAELYHQALAQGASGGETCLRIQGEETRGDCASWVARKAAEADDFAAAEAACGALGEGLWRDECFFQLADGFEASDDWGKRLCEQSGRFRLKCLDHVARRTLGRMMKDMPLGQEAARQDAGMELAMTMVGRPRAQRFARRAVAGEIAMRPDEPFQLATCGTASELVCVLAYRRRIQDRTSTTARQAGGATLGARLDGICPAPVDMETVVAAGFSAWSADADAVAQEAWRVTCTEAAAEPPPR